MSQNGQTHFKKLAANALYIKGLNYKLCCISQCENESQSAQF